MNKPYVPLMHFSVLRVNKKPARIFVCAGIMLLWPGWLTPAAKAAADRPIVVELYTSQGCAACVVADGYLQKLAARDDVIALTLPVTYWDYLGWKDSFARPEFDNRQRAFATAAGLSDIYTPQIIIDGEYHEIGSQTDVIDDVIAFQLGAHPPAIVIDLWPLGRTVAVNIGAGVLPKGALSATVWLAQYDVKRQIAVKAGENAGKELSYANLVRTLTPLAVWHGEALGLSLPVRELRKDGYSGFAVLLQADDAGPILGAAKMDMGKLAK